MVLRVWRFSKIVRNGHSFHSAGIVTRVEWNSNEQDFASLSLRDLVEARDLYHFHLMNKANVIGTAVGFDRLSLVLPP